MPVYQPDHVEYSIVSGHIHIAMDDGTQIPAYWSHPNIGGVFPGIVLIHDWWGITQVERHLAQMFAQVGYYVIVPDLFDGKAAATPQDAIALVEALGDGGYPRVDTALQVLETHHRCNRDVAAVGMGMGGSLAFVAAVTRDDLEAAVAYYGFPQRVFSRLGAAKAPILALYGSREPHISTDVRERLARTLGTSPLPHEVRVIEGAARDFFTSGHGHDSLIFGQVWRDTLAFLEQHLNGPTRPPEAKAF